MKLRDEAIARKTHELHVGARQLERISRHEPWVSWYAGIARRSLAIIDPIDCDCTLTSRDVDELARKASNGDEDALAEFTRRESIAA